MLKQSVFLFLFVVCFILFSSFISAILVILTGLIYAIFNYFKNDRGVLKRLIGLLVSYWTKFFKNFTGVPSHFSLSKGCSWDMDNVNKSSSGLLDKWDEKSECFSPIYRSRLLPKYRSFAKATSTPISSPHIASSNNDQYRYSLHGSSKLKNYSNIYDKSPVNLPKVWSNSSLSTFTDSRSYGLAGRIVDYNTKSEEQNNRSKFRARPFPIVRLFKKELPVISTKPSTVTIQLAQPDSANYETEQRKLILQEIMQEKHPKQAENTETRSVLDALREISRKRIHPDALKEMSNGHYSSNKNQDNFNYKSSCKRLKEDTVIQKKSDVGNKISEKKYDFSLPCVDPITASLTSSDKEFVKQHLRNKRKATNDSFENEKNKKQIKLQNVQTQTSTELFSAEPIISPKLKGIINKQINEEKSPRKKRVPPVKVFDDKPLEINRKKRLAYLLSAMSGHADEPDFESLDETFKSPPNKDKPDKHVTFNETVEIRKIVSENDSSSLLKSPVTKSSESTFTSLNSPVTTFSTSLTSQVNTVTSNITPVSSVTIKLPELTPQASKNNQFVVSSPNSQFNLVKDKKSEAKSESQKPGGFKFDLITSSESTPTSLFTLPVSSISSNVSSFNAPPITSTPKFQFSNNTNPHITSNSSGSDFQKPETPKAIPGNFTFKADNLPKLSSGMSTNSNQQVANFSFGSNTNNKTNTAVSSVENNLNTQSTTSTSFNNNMTITTATSQFAVNNTFVSSPPLTGIVHTSKVTSSPVASLFNPSTATLANTELGKETKSVAAISTSVTPSFGFTSAFQSPKTTSTSEKTETFSFGNNPMNFKAGNTNVSTPSFVFGTTVTSGVVSSSTNPSLFMNNPTTTSTLFGNKTAVVSFGSIGTTVSTASTTTGATTKTSTFNTNVFGNSGTGLSISSPSTFPTTQSFGLNTKPVASFGSNPAANLFSTTAQPSFNFSSNPQGTNAFNSNSKSTSVFGTTSTTTVSFGANSSPAVTFASSTPANASFASNTPGNVSFGSNTPATVSFGSNTPATVSFGTSTPATVSFVSNTPKNVSFNSNTPSTTVTFGLKTQTTSSFTSNSQPNFAFGSNSQPTPLFGSSSAFGTNTTAFPTNSQPGSSFATTTSTFGAKSQPTPVFGSNNQSTTAFGTTTQPNSSVFGNQQPSSTSFGQTQGFGSNNQTSLPTFGSTTFGSTSGFGSNNQTIGFGANTANTSFGKNASQTDFGQTPQTGFNAQASFGAASQGTFGASTTQAGFGSTSQTFNVAPQTNFGSGQALPVFGAGTNQTPFGSNTQSGFGGSSGPVQSGFSFGGTNTASGTSTGVFSFGSNADANKTAPNFTSGSNFGAPPFATPNFNAPTAGMFSIGSGGSSNTSKSRNITRARRRVT